MGLGRGKAVAAAAVLALAAACAARRDDPPPAAAPGGPPTMMNSIADRYVSLVLALGVHDADYVDAYYGPPGEAHRGPGGEAAAARGSASPRPPLLSALEAAPAGRRRAGHPAPPVPHAAAPGPGRPGGHVVGREDDLRRGVAGAVRRRGAAPGRGPLPADPRRARRAAARAGPARRPLHRLPRWLRHPDGRSWTPSSPRPSPSAAGARFPTSTCPPGETFTVEYVTGKSWSAYNWYQGGFKQPDPGQHGPADLHRPRHRPGLPRGLPRPPRVQRAAREAPGEGPRLAGVHRLSPVQPPVADRRGHRQLRHRGGLSRRRARALRARAPVPAGRARPRAGRASTTACASSWTGCPTRATRPRGATWTARSTPPGRRRWLEQYALMPADRARQRIRFFDQYRSYVINYNLGQDMVRAYIESRGGTARPPRGALAGVHAAPGVPRLPGGLKPAPRPRR